MGKLQALINSKYTLWIVLSAAWLVAVYRYVLGETVYGEFVHTTGELSARLMMLALAATPLRLMFPGAGWAMWLVRQRRALGVAAFAFASPHLAAYIIRLEPARIASEALELGMLTGWVAFVIFVALALTSNDWSVRQMGRRWKTLHRLVYVAAALTFAHWILTAFDPLAGLLHLSVLAFLEGYRIWKVRRTEHSQF
jgi:methionine sulfoxide reductase heme-binding subunit